MYVYYTHLCIHLIYVHICIHILHLAVPTRASYFDNFGSSSTQGRVANTCIPYNMIYADMCHILRPGDSGFDPLGCATGVPNGLRQLKWWVKTPGIPEIEHQNNL